jgi:predicted phosphodiesterase
VSPTRAKLRIGVVGDVHLRWDDRDVADLDAARYDLLAFVGDLTGYRRDATEVARSVSRLATPALVIPGNHDGASLPHLAAETF